jgi:hypothetical protein
MENPGSHWTVFCEIVYWGILVKFVDRLRLWRIWKKVRHINEDLSTYIYSIGLYSGSRMCALRGTK